MRRLRTAQVDGSVQIRSYLAGNPPIKIKLNDDLVGEGGWGVPPPVGVWCLVLVVLVVVQSGHLQLSTASHP